MRLAFIATLLAAAAALPQTLILRPEDPEDVPRTGITFGAPSKTGITFTPLPTTTIVSSPIIFKPTPTDERITTTTKSKPTKEPSPSPVCVNGRGTVEVGGYDIDYALASAPAGFPRLGGYKISSVWEQRHQIGTMSLSLGIDWAEYGEFKCQYTCNSQADCVAFAGWRVQDRGRDAHFECHLYNALVTEDAFTLVGFDSSTYTLHVFNKFCSSRVGKRSIEENEKRDEAIFSKAGSSGLRCRENEVACPINSNCAGLGLIDARPGEKWERYYLSGEWVLKHRWAGFVQEAEFSEARLARVKQQCKVACVRNLGKCGSFAVAYGLPSDQANESPDFVLSENPNRAFTCNLFFQSIDAAQYRRDTAGVWIHFQGVNVECTNPL